MPSSGGDQRIVGVLTVAKQILDTVQGPLNLVPVPGLSGVASALSTIIDVVLVAKGNEGTREDVANHINALISIIGEMAKKARSVLGTGDDGVARNHLVNSPELNGRVAALEKDLNDLMNDTTSLETGCLGFVCGKKNANTLVRIKGGIGEATRKFHIQGGITVEMLINGIVTDIEEMKLSLQQERTERERKEQQEHAERERKEQQQLDEKALDELPRVNAGYSSSQNLTTSGTLEGTRTALLKEITEWADTGDDGSFICVLTGGVGTGKSTIAFEMAHRLKEAGALGASFFFVRGGGELSTTTKVSATIAYQLADYHPSLYPHIAKAAREYSRRGKQGEKLQMELDNLIIKPLMNVDASHRPIILVFDALDECTAQDEVIRLLSLFVERLPRIPFPVRILVTTRPEMKIEAALNTEKLRGVLKTYNLHEIPRHIVDGDIKIFFDVRLKEAGCLETVLDSHPRAVTDLTKLAAGLFIYADTVVRLLDRNPDHVPKILADLLSSNPSDASSYKLQNLDKLYITVLENAFHDDNIDILDTKNYIPVVLGSLALLQEQISASGLSDLLGVEIRFIRDILRRLSSVILGPGKDDDEIRMLHASFPRLLVNTQRCTDLKEFYIDQSVHHQRLALTCLKVMTTKYPLKRNICNLHDPTIMKSDIPGLHDIVKRCIRPSLQYSCVHWATHLSQCNDPGQDILDAVMEFTRTKLLVWVEVLSYMNQLEVAVSALLAALSWCEKNLQSRDPRNEIIQIIDDAHRLILQCYTPINDCPAHLYISALPLAPLCALTTCYSNSDNTLARHHTIIRSKMPRDAEWGACLHTILMDARNCRAMLSPSGRLIASGSSNGEVCIWDASIGFSKRTLKGHTKSVLCVAWAPDGEFIASGSADGTIRVWNATSGVQEHAQDVQITECNVYAIVWGQGGTQLITVSKPEGIHLWDIVIGKELKRRMTFPLTGTALAISKDLGRVVEWTAGFGKLQFWDLGSGDDKIYSKELLVKFFVDAAVFLHGDTQIAFCGRDDALHVWDLELGESTPEIRLTSEVTWPSRTFIYGIAVSTNGNVLATSTGDKIHFFNTKSWDSLGSLQGYFRYSASFSPDDHRLLTSYTTINMWDLSPLLAQKSQITSFTPSSLPSPIVKHDSQIHFVAVSLGDSQRVAAVSSEAVSIWSLQSASLLWIISGGGILGQIAFSPDAQKIAVAEVRKICVWDITTTSTKTEPDLMQSINTANRTNDRITWSPNGNWIAGPTYHPDTTRGLGVFNAATGELEQWLALNSNEDISDLEFSDDNTMLYVKCDTDEAIFRWEEGEKVELKQRWETEIGRRMRLHKEAWIVREEDGKRLCWVGQGHPLCIARCGDYYVVGKDSGKVDILHTEKKVVS